MFASIKGEGFDADTRRHSAEHLGPFQADHCQAACVVVGDKQDATVRMKGHVHRPSAELQEFLRLELGVEYRTQRCVVACDNQILPVRL
jgi:hypothetical protein